MRIKFDKKNIKNQIPMDEIEIFFLIQLKDRGPLCNFARPAYLLRWRGEKRGGELSLELLHVIDVDTHCPTV
jgi:hypothetical protein